MSQPKLPDDLQSLLDRVQAFHSGAKPHHDAARKRWDHFYRLYRSYKDLKRSYSQAETRRDVDDILKQQESVFGSNIFVPYVFSVIETTLPRTVDAMPRLRAKPCDPESEANAENVRTAIEHAQGRMKFPLALQDVGKSGLIYGLGVGITYHDERYRKGKKYLARPTVPTTDGSEWVEETRDALVFSGPRFEALDVYDFFWPAMAHDLNTLPEAIARSWRSKRYVADKFKSGEWALPPKWDLELVLSQGSSADRDTIWAERQAASGNEGVDNRGTHVHEVWQFHDGDEVITVLDREVPVAREPNPHWHGELPFQIYRPTRVPHEMLGIGEAEAIEDLQDEMNELRSMRRDNAAVALQRPMAYFDGLVDPANVALGPASIIPVDGDPRELLFPFTVPEIPFSSYQEEDRLQRDIERVTGIDDTVSGAEGGGGASATATGVQLVQAAANVRIKLKAKRLVAECAEPSSQQQLEIIQQHSIRHDPESGRTVANPLYIPKPADTESGWQGAQMGPEELMGSFIVEIEGDSMMPENQAARIEEASRMMQAFSQDEHMDPLKVREYALTRFGIDDAKAWFVTQDAIPAEAWQLISEALAEQGVPPEFLEELKEGAMMAVEEMASGGDVDVPDDG